MGGLFSFVSGTQKTGFPFREAGSLYLSDGRMALDVVDNIINSGECHRYACVSAAIVDSDASGIGINQCCAGEGNVLNVAYALVDLLRREKILCAAVLNLPGLVLVENAGGEAVNEAVAALENAVIEAKPALRGLYRNRTCADLLGLPCLEGSHNVSVLAPVLHIGRLGDVHITEGSMAGIGRTGEHQELVVDLSGEENAVSVERQECVLTLIEGLEIVGVADADGRLPAVSVAPGNPVSVLNPANAGVIAVAPLINFLGSLVSLLENDAVGVDIPVDTVLGEAGMELHISHLIVNTENACELALKGNNCTVED